ADGRIGRFGWKANAPSLREFIRDALSNELGLSVPAETDFNFGFRQDGDSVRDPEVIGEDLRNLNFFMLMLGPPPRQPSAMTPTAIRGQQVFADIGCSKCHIPSMPAMVEGAAIDVPLYSDL